MDANTIVIHKRIFSGIVFEFLEHTNKRRIQTIFNSKKYFIDMNKSNYYIFNDLLNDNLLMTYADFCAPYFSLCCEPDVGECVELQLYNFSKSRIKYRIIKTQTH